ncbi:endothelin-converting enzyme 2-like [Dendronephthya gigantea]|uniref:endothelin-converting enzyme 2-like n=1 Tax=Dendronephthya gigantea TaxID=151771 RepID=UPI00106D7E6D|nr:endothelin-converting enzyme 2-like [Dendronephthya gigantea]
MLQDPNSAVSKAFTFYKSCMSDASIETAGTQPIFDVIEKYGSCNIIKSNWSGDSWVLAKVLGRVFAETSLPVFLNVDIEKSFFNTSEIFISISSGLSGYDDDKLNEEKPRSKEKDLPLHDKPSKKIPANDFEDYGKYISSIFKLFGTNSIVDNASKSIVKLEDNFLKIRKILDGDDADAVRNNVKFFTIDELNHLTSFKSAPERVRHISCFSLLANEIIWRIIRKFIDSLPKGFRKAREKYYATFGVRPTPRWKACNDLTNQYFTHATTLLYVNKRVTEDALEKAAVMFAEIKAEFVDGLEEHKWMDDATRSQARLKLQKMKEWIGYSSFIKNTTELHSYYKNFQVKESFLLQNMLNAVRNLILKKSQQLGKPSDDSSFSTSTLPVNAFYLSKDNRIVILGGILQPPFYESGRLKAMNYGSLGFIVGHEISHGFDEDGSGYDENGNIRHWWTKVSHDNFVERSKCLIDQYSNVTIFGYQVNGTQTLSENIADNGGLKYAYRAYQKWRETHGDEDRLPALSLDNNQLFFVSFAQTWCDKYGEGAVKYFMDNDEHSLDPVRVRVPLYNFLEFSKAFGCASQTDTCVVW